MSHVHALKRRSKRTKSVVPVSLRIAGSDTSYLAHTLDVSNHGVKLGGCLGEMKVGDKIEIRYRHKQAQFRVAWVISHKGSSEKQIGAECLEPGKQVWVRPSLSKWMSTQKKSDVDWA